MIRRIVAAPDSFKGSLTAKEAAEAIEKGIKKFDNSIEVVKVPMADGGEGTVQSMVDATGGRMISVTVKGPMLNEVEAFYGILGDGRTAVIEMAAASGLPLVKPGERNPLKATTYGTGELIRHALDMGCTDIIIGIGGSATNDGGAGALQALGVRFLDADRNDIGAGGGDLGRLQSIDVNNLDPRIKDTVINVACDVDNPLCGPKGASFIFGPQKGADSAMVEELDRNLAHYADLVESTLGVRIKDFPGAGAAGGLGGGLLAFLGANLKKGVDLVIETVELEKKIKDADLVITGEGMMDHQTIYGKTPFGVARTAKKYGIPVIAICGSIGKGAEVLYDNGFASIFSIIDRPMGLDEAMEKSSELIRNCSERVVRALSISGL
jgi:glycerate kinase